jgi:hypothetical protein
MYISVKGIVGEWSCMSVKGIVGEWSCICLLRGLLASGALSNNTLNRHT